MPAQVRLLRRLHQPRVLNVLKFAAQSILIGRLPLLLQLEFLLQMIADLSMLFSR